MDNSDIALSWRYEVLGDRADEAQPEDEAEAKPNPEPTGPPYAWPALTARRPLLTLVLVRSHSSSPPKHSLFCSLETAHHRACLGPACMLETLLEGYSTSFAPF